MTPGGLTLRRVEEGDYYAGTADRNPVYTEGLKQAAVFTRRDDAIRRARGIAGEEWGKTFALTPSTPPL